MVGSLHDGSIYRSVTWLVVYTTGLYIDGVVSRRESMGVASGLNLWVWLQCIGVVSGCCCKEVYNYVDILIIIITFPYSTCISSFFLQLHLYFFVHF